jgi:hypothetical protein
LIEDDWSFDMNWYKISQEDFGSIVANEYGEESYKWPKG